MPVDIVVVPENPPDRQHCLVWTNPNTNKTSAPFACGTRADCEKALAQYATRAKRAEDNGWDSI